MKKENVETEKRKALNSLYVHTIAQLNIPETATTRCNISTRAGSLKNQLCLKSLRPLC